MLYMWPRSFRCNECPVHMTGKLFPLADNNAPGIAGALQATRSLCRCQHFRMRLRTGYTSARSTMPMGLSCSRRWASREC